MTRRSWLLAVLQAREARELAQEALRGHQEDEPEQPPKEGGEPIMRALERRLAALEAVKNDSISVWFPDMEKPAGHDAAGIRIEFPDSEELPDEIA